MTDTEAGLWDELHKFLEEHEDRYGLRFQLERNRGKWTASITPTKLHPDSFDYDLFQTKARFTRETVIRLALAFTRARLKETAPQEVVPND